MKTFFSIMLIFLFLSCGGGKKTPESVIPDKDSVSDGDITEVDESDDDEDSLSDADEDIETVSDTCEAEPCKGLENSTGECIDEDKGYSCECLEKYGWSADDKKCLEARTAECTGLPENAEWHGPTSITQMTRDGEEWFPSTEGAYRLLGECEDSCCFRCAKNYTWFDNECLDPDTIKGQCSSRPCKNMPNSTGVCRVEDEWPWYSCECLEGYTFIEKNQYEIKCLLTRPAECTGLPEHAEWNEVSSITQKSEDGEYWFPETTASWNARACTAYCCFECAETYFWNGSDCVNLCDQDPCKDVENSTGECFSVGPVNYTCGCEEGYYWWGEKRGCLAKKPALGNICTGLHDCFDNNKKIDCPVSGEDFYGQDANYAEAGMCAWHDFALNSEFPEEPTILNRNTGLEWTWRSPQNMPWKEAVDYCENLTYAGKSDWRLPAMLEIFSIYDDDTPPLNMSILTFLYFYGMPYPGIWSSDTYSHNTDQAWGGFCTITTSFVYSYDKTKSLGVFCVRGNESAAPLFEEKTLGGDKVVTDSATGFMWNKDYVFKGEWKQALNYCENLVYAGYSDWRLPNKNEILSLIDYGKYNPASDFPGIIGESTDSFYLFSSTSFLGFKNVETVFAVDGKWKSDNKAETNYYRNRNVRCVRSDLCGEGLFLKGAECVHDPCSQNSCEVPNSTGICIPKTETAYECQCLEGYFWDGNKCVDPCAADPCSKVANSDGNCTALNSSKYLCGCKNGFGWNSGKCESSASGVATLGNICIGTETITLPGILKCKTQDFELKTVSDQEIVVDKNTGLEWQHAVSERTYTWNEAVAYCENLEYAGFSDWRLPEPLEILTIVNHGAYDIDADAYNDTPQLLVNKLYFGSVFPSFDVGNNLWTSKTYQDDPKRAWVFSPQRSYVYTHPSKTNIYNAMCVRGGILPRAEFKKSEISGDAVVTDSATGFMWQKGFTVMEDAEHSNAIEYCDNLTYAGYSDWRLPNKNELASLFSFDTTFSDFFDMPAKYDFISSTTFVLNATYPGEPFLIVDEKAMTINQKGEVGYAEIKKGSYNVRCVRNIE